MKNIWFVIQREYLEKVRNRTFWILTLLGPLAYVLLILLPILLTSFGGTERIVSIKDLNGGFERLKDPDSGNLYFVYQESEINEDNYGDFNSDALIIIPNQNTLNDFRIELHSKESLGRSNVVSIKKILQKRLEKLRLASIDLDRGLYEGVREKLQLKELISSKKSEASAEFMTMFSLFGVVFMMLLMTLYGSMVLKGVQEEKKNRIIEVLLVSMKPFDLMMGKILGISLVGFTQFIVWVLGIFIINLFLMPVIGLSAIEPMSTSNMGQTSPEQLQISVKLMKELMEIEWGTFLMVFFSFFLAGYFLYSSIYAAIGAMMNDDSEMQSMMMIIMVPIFLGYMISFSAAEDPNSTMAFWSSMVPFFSPFVILSIWPFVPVWQILLSFLVLIFGVILMVKLSAKLYRMSILLYGQKVTLGRFFQILFS